MFAVFARAYANTALDQTAHAFHCVYFIILINIMCCNKRWKRRHKITRNGEDRTTTKVEPIFQLTIQDVPAKLS